MRPPSRHSTVAEHGLVLALFTLLSVVMTWPLATLLDQGIDMRGDAVLQITTMVVGAQRLFSDPTHLFDAPYLYPYAHTLAYADHLLGQTLLTLPLLLAGHPALAVNGYKLFTFIASGYGTYLLVRDTTDSRVGALLAGIAFAFSGWRFIHIGQVNILATEWFPLTLWALRRGLARASGRWLALAGLFMVAMALCSVYYFYFLLVAVGLYLLFYFRPVALQQGTTWLVDRFAGRWRQARPVDPAAPLYPKPRLRHPFWLAFVGMLLAAVVGVCYVPYSQVNSELGFARSIYEVQNWSAVPSYYWSVLPTNLFWGGLFPLMTSPLGERELFPGLILLVLAVLGVLFARRATPPPTADAPLVSAPHAPRPSERAYWIVLGLGAFVLTFGLSYRLPNSVDVPLPYALLYDWAPGFQALRVPVRFFVLVDLALCVLAGWGVGALGMAWRRLAQTLRPTWRVPQTALGIGLATLVGGGILGESAQLLDLSKQREMRPAVMQPWSWLAEHGTGPVIEFPFYGDSGDIWYAYWGTYHHLPLVNGWSAFMPPGTVALSRAMHAFPDPATVALLQGLEVRHVVVHLWQYSAADQATWRTRLAAIPALTLAYQAGEDYVYTLAADPWLRRLMEGSSGPQYSWFSAGLGAAHPEMEVLAYFADYVANEQLVYGDMPVGYKPPLLLPWGAPADMIVQPPDAPAPPNYIAYRQDAAVSVYSRDPALQARYDLLVDNSPPDDPAGITFPRQFPYEISTQRLLFGATTTTTLTLRQPGATPDVPINLILPPGVSTYVGPLYVGPLTGTRLMFEPPLTGGARLLAAELWASPPADPPGLTGQAATLLLSARPAPYAAGDGEIGTHIEIVPRAPGAAPDHWTLTLDIYQKPWGTHPDGHYGSFSVPVPVSTDGHTYDLALRVDTQVARAWRDGQPTEVFAWQGPPRTGDFAASLVLHLGDQQVQMVPLYDFTLRDGQLRAVQFRPARTVWTPLGP